jgi:hypothetical protein
VFVSLINGNCVEYSHQGNLRRSYLTNEPNYQINHLISCGNFLVINLRHKTLSNNFKTIFFEKGTSIIKYVLNDNLIYKKAFLKSNQEIYLLSETENQFCQFIKWNTLTGNFSLVYSSSTLIPDAVQLNEDNVIFCSDDGSLKQITFSNSTINLLLNGKLYNQLYFSNLNQKLFAVHQSGIDVHQQQGAVLINQQEIIFSDSIVKVNFLNLK